MATKVLTQKSPTAIRAGKDAAASHRSNSASAVVMPPVIRMPTGHPKARTPTSR
jgi:hypothetical protein